MFKPSYSTRLNSFKVQPQLFFENPKKITAIDLLHRAGKVKGLTFVDLNYPEHFQKIKISDIQETLEKEKLTVNSVAPRYYLDHAFDSGALTNINKEIRQQAIDLTKKSIEAALKLGTNLVTLWISNEGYEYPFQTNYSKQYDLLVESLLEITSSYPEVNISIEYKPNEPRAVSIVPNIHATLNLLSDISAKNTGITLDFCHSLYAKENPANAASLAFKKSQLLGLHMNDGYGYKDDGLTTGSIHFLETLELYYTLATHGYKGAIYFDTFPTYQDPIKECETNIKLSNILVKKVNTLLQKKIDFTKNSEYNWIKVLEMVT